MFSDGKDEVHEKQRTSRICDEVWEECNTTCDPENPKLRESTRESWNFPSLLNYLIHRMLTSIQGKPWFRYWRRTTLTFLTATAKNLPNKLIETNIVTNKLSYSVTVLLPPVISVLLYDEEHELEQRLDQFFPCPPSWADLGATKILIWKNVSPSVSSGCLLNPRLKGQIIYADDWKLGESKEQYSVEKEGKTRWHCD